MALHNVAHGDTLSGRGAPCEGGQKPARYTDGENMR
jgi:hypothetical protein